MMFKELAKEQEIEFRTYAQQNNPPNMADWALYHPICREEWTKRGITPDTIDNTEESKTMEKSVHIVNNVHTQTVYFSDSMKEVDCKSFMFGMMVELAQGTVESYRSDFYYDAMFIKALTLDTPYEFYYMFGESGTTIIHKGETHFSSYALAMECRKYNRPFVYKVELLKSETWDSKAWILRFTCLATDKDALPAYNYSASFNAGA